MKIETTSIHEGYKPNQGNGSVAQPIVLSTTFERGEAGAFVEGRDIYSRASNPNRRALEEKLGALEGGEAMAFSSGQAATMSIFHALQSGDHVMLPDDIYYGTRLMLESLYGRWGLTFSAVNTSDLNEIKAATNVNTKLIWLETPSNPQLKVADIQLVTDFAKKNKILVACDNTWSTPMFTRPLSMGVDFVMHSTTKYFGGHSDIIGGCVVVEKGSEMAVKIREFQTIGGAVPSPFDAWLLYRSLATFPMRMNIHATNAMALATYLEAHSMVEKVHYPGLKTNEYHEVAARQMTGGFGGMMSILVKGGSEATLKLASALKVVTHATSLGSVESLVDHRFTAEGVHSKSPENLLRISVGIENIEDIIEDFRQAFEAI